MDTESYIKSRQGVIDNLGLPRSLNQNQVKDIQRRAFEEGVKVGKGETLDPVASPSVVIDQKNTGAKNSTPGQIIAHTVPEHSVAVDPNKPAPNVQAGQVLDPNKPQPLLVHKEGDTPKTVVKQPSAQEPVKGPVSQGTGVATGNPAPNSPGSNNPNQNP